MKTKDDLMKEYILKKIDRMLKDLPVQTHAYDKLCELKCWVKKIRPRAKRRPGGL